MIQEKCVSRKLILTGIALALCAGAMALTACGGGGGGNGSISPPTPSTFDMSKALQTRTNQGLTANFSISGTVNANGTNVSVGGSGTVQYAAATNGTFNNNPALSQVVSTSGTITFNGQSSPLSAAVTDYYATGTFAFAFVGETNSNSYEIAQNPFTYPTSVSAGSSGNLGTVLRYTDSTQSVPLGKVDVSYSVRSNPSDTNSVIVEIIEKEFDGNNTLQQTTKTDFAITAAGGITFVSGQADGGGSSITFTAQ